MAQVGDQGGVGVPGREGLRLAGAGQFLEEVEGEAGGGAVEAGDPALPVLVTGHGGHRVETEGTVEVQRGGAGEHQIAGLGTAAAAAVSRTVTVVLVPIEDIVHGHVVGREGRAGGEAVHELHLGEEGGQQAGRIGLVGVHQRNGHRVEVLGGRVRPVVLLLAGLVQDVVAVGIDLVHRDGVREGEGVVQRGGAGALGDFGVLRGVGEHDVQPALEPGLHLRLDVRLAGITGVAGRGRGAGLVEVAAGEEVVELVGAAGVAQVVVLGITLLHHLALPVRVDDDLRAAGEVAAGVKRVGDVERVPGERSLSLLVGPLGALAGLQVAVEDELIVVRGMRHLVLARDGGDAVGGVEIHVALAGLAGLGGDDHDAVRRAGAVQGGGRGILQHRDGLDVLRVDAGQDAGGGVRITGVLGVIGARGGHAVDHVQRRGGGVERTGTADAEGGRGARLAGGGAHLKAGNLALEGLLHGGDGLLGQFVGADHRGGTRVGGLLRRAVGDDDGLVQEFGAGRELHVQEAVAPDGNLHGLIADGGEDQDAVRRDADRIDTIHIGNDTLRGAADDDGGSGNRIAVRGVRHCALDRDVLRSERHADGKGQNRE